MPPPYPESIVGKACIRLNPSGSRITPGVNRGEPFFGPAQNEQEFVYGPVEQIERREKRKRRHRRHSSGAGPDRQEAKIPAQSKTSAQGLGLPTLFNRPPPAIHPAARQVDHNRCRRPRLYRPETDWREIPLGRDVRSNGVDNESVKYRGEGRVPPEREKI